MKRFIFLCTAGLSGLGVMLPACGSLDSDTNSAPPLATLRGNLLDANPGDVSSSSAIRVAVIWRVSGSEQFNVAEDLPVQPVFPAAFSIALDGPPPAVAMNTSSTVPVYWCVPDSGIPESPECALLPEAGAPIGAGSGQAGGPPSDGGGNDEPDAALGPPPPQTPPRPPSSSRYAVGTVVAYLDQNHNGKLDLVGADASSSVDRILAANQDMSIVYVEGPITNEFPFAPVVDESGHGPTDGYNLLLDPHCNEPPEVQLPACPSAAPAPVPDAGACAPLQWLGMNTPYPLTVASSPAVASLVCGTQTPGISGGSAPIPPYDPALQPAQYPSPGDPGVCCASDGSNYLYTTCTQTSQGLCRGPLESCTSVGYERPGAGTRRVALHEVARTPHWLHRTARSARKRSRPSMRSMDSSCSVAAARSCATQPSPTTPSRRRS